MLVVSTCRNSSGAFHELEQRLLHALAYPIVRTSDGVVLDGRNRLKACEIAGIDPRFEVYEGSNPVGFITRAKSAAAVFGSFR